ncbi:MAG: hypothetical protein QNL16_00610 [Rhodobacterales bacterium]
MSTGFRLRLRDWPGFGKVTRCPDTPEAALVLAGDCVWQKYRWAVAFQFGDYHVFAVPSMSYVD